MILAGIVAGGSGSRMGSELPKQFLPLGTKPVLIHTIEAFCRDDGIDAIIVGIHPAWKEETRRLLREYLPERPVLLTDGGIHRNDTVERMVNTALTQLHCREEDIFLTHDAVRPFVTSRIIRDSIRAMEHYPICTAAIPETDTVAVSSGGTIAEAFPDRQQIFRIQTPQTFRIGEFCRIYGSLSEEEKAAATDVCSLFHQKGLSVGLVQGDIMNLKLTFPPDRIIAETYVRSAE